MAAHRFADRAKRTSISPASGRFRFDKTDRSTRQYACRERLSHAQLHPSAAGRFAYSCRMVNREPLAKSSQARRPKGYFKCSYPLAGDRLELEKAMSKVRQRVRKE